jgi:hypothetical protein
LLAFRPKEIKQHTDPEITVYGAYGAITTVMPGHKLPHSISIRYARLMNYVAADLIRVDAHFRREL